jgi:hypothetical protein
MKTLKESILQDADVTLSVTDDDMREALYPVPTVKDFDTLYRGYIFVDWYCEPYIQKYADKLNIQLRPLHLSRGTISSTKDLNCIRVCIYGSAKDADIKTYFISKIDPNSRVATTMFELYGVGDWISNSMATTKKGIIEALQYLSKHPEDFKKLVDCNNRCANELENTGMCDNRTFKAILGY